MGVHRGDALAGCVTGSPLLKSHLTPVGAHPLASLDLGRQTDPE